MKCLFCNKICSERDDYSLYIRCESCKNNFIITYSSRNLKSLNWLTIQPPDYINNRFHIALCYDYRLTELFFQSKRILVLPYVADINPDNFYQKLSLMKTFL